MGRAGAVTKDTGPLVMLQTAVRNTVAGTLLRCPNVLAGPRRAPI